VKAEVEGWEWAEKKGRRERGRRETDRERERVQRKKEREIEIKKEMCGYNGLFASTSRSHTR
jgi:hypothetical protein